MWVSSVPCGGVWVAAGADVGAPRIHVSKRAGTAAVSRPRVHMGNPGPVEGTDQRVAGPRPTDTGRASVAFAAPRLPRRTKIALACTVLAVAARIRAATNVSIRTTIVLSTYYENRPVTEGDGPVLVSHAAQRVDQRLGLEPAARHWAGDPRRTHCPPEQPKRRKTSSLPLRCSRR